METTFSMTDLLSKSHKLLLFWFGEDGNTDNSSMWFKNPGTDMMITTKFDYWF